MHIRSGGQMELAEFRIRQALALFIKDGTEIHGAIDAALDPIRELKTFTTVRGTIRRAAEKRISWHCPRR
jgi:hypothetical protein